MTQPNKAASLPSHFVRADDGCRSSDGGGFPAVPRSCSKRESLPYRHKQKRDIHFYNESLLSGIWNSKWIFQNIIEKANASQKSPIDISKSPSEIIQKGFFHRLCFIVCGCFISTVREKYSFFQFSPWQALRLRHFAIPLELQGTTNKMPLERFQVENVLQETDSSCIPTMYLHCSMPERACLTI